MGKNKNRPKTTFFWIFIAGVGCIPLIVGTSIFASRIRWLQSTERAVGTVVATEQSKSRNRRHGKHRRHSNKPRYKSVVEYVVAERTHQLRSEVSHAKPPKTGVQVQIAFDPEDPSISHIVSFGELWMLPLLFCTVGGIFVAIAIAGCAYDRRARAP